jgi:glycerol-3-phosphate cytidylyltransferase
MVKVITYGTYDLLHYGHIRLLERARALGDYLIVGVTADGFDKARGKINVQQSLMERVEAVKATGLADKIIIEDYIGQKIDDIQKYDVDIFAIGSDWEGKFDYLNEYCQVVYLPRTEGISSTMLREDLQDDIEIGVVGAGRIAQRFVPEASFVSYVKVNGIYDIDDSLAYSFANKHKLARVYESYEALLENVQAVYIATPHLSHYELCKRAILQKKHVLCETPLVLKAAEAKELFELAKTNDIVLMEANKTAHSPAFNHLITMIKSGVIGDVVDVSASESKLWGEKFTRELDPEQAGGSMFELGSYPLLPILRLMGTNYLNINIYSKMINGVDVYTRGIMRYPNGVCSFQLGLGVKTEGNMVVSGTKGYAYVPAPWWLTDYYEFRFEDQNQNKKFFYKWDGAGLRYEIQEFVSCIFNHRLTTARLRQEDSITMAQIMQDFSERKNMMEI